MKVLLACALLLLSPASFSEDEPPQIVENAGDYWVFARTVPPAYPKEAMNERITGYVKVIHTINEKGKVRDVEVIESVPSEIFIRPTLRALKRFRFKPAEGNEERKPIRTEFVMHFKLTSEKGGS